MIHPSIPLYLQVTTKPAEHPPRYKLMYKPLVYAARRQVPAEQMQLQHSDHDKILVLVTNYVIQRMVIDPCTVENAQYDSQIHVKGQITKPLLDWRLEPT